MEQSFQVIIETQNVTEEKHNGLLDFGYLTVIDTYTDHELRFDSTQYFIEENQIIVAIQQTGIDEKDQPLAMLIDWETISADKRKYKVEMYVGFDDAVDEQSVPPVKYGRAYVDYGVQSGDKTLDIELDNYCE